MSSALMTCDAKHRSPVLENNREHTKCACPERGPDRYTHGRRAAAHRVHRPNFVSLRTFTLRHAVVRSCNWGIDAPSCSVILGMQKSHNTNEGWWNTSGSLSPWNGQGKETQRARRLERHHSNSPKNSSHHRGKLEARPVSMPEERSFCSSLFVWNTGVWKKSWDQVKRLWYLDLLQKRFPFSVSECRNRK